MHRQNKRSATHKKNGVRKINGGHKGMTLADIEAQLDRETERLGEIYKNLMALRYEIKQERRRREQVELHLVVRRRGRPSKFLRDLPTLEEQGLIPKAEETDGAQEAQQ